jgi:signal peptidase
MNFWKIVYYIVMGFLAVVVLVLILSAFPIAGNFKILTVLSGSMEPKIHTGSVVFVNPEKDYKIGDIITFGPYSKTKPPTTHRIFDIKVVSGEPVYITRGDANESPDTREIAKKDVVGKVLFSVPYFGYVISFIKKPFGFVLLIIVPAILILFDEIRKIINEVKQKNLEKEKTKNV